MLHESGVIYPIVRRREYVKSNKNDTIDAAAIAEAVTRPTMRFVELKRPDQVDLQALHRIRDQMVGNRTRLICQMRAFCLEYGIAIRQGAGLFKLALPRIIAEDSNDLTPTMRRLLQEIFDNLKTLESRIPSPRRALYRRLRVSDLRAGADSPSANRAARMFARPAVPADQEPPAKLVV